MRKSTTLRLLDSRERYLAAGLKVYDSFIKKDVVDNQFHSLDEFLNSVDLAVIMVKHNKIMENKGKLVLDCHNICNLEGDYRI